MDLERTWGGGDWGELLYTLEMSKMMEVLNAEAFICLDKRFGDHRHST